MTIMYWSVFFKTILGMHSRIFTDKNMMSEICLKMFKGRVSNRGTDEMVGDELKVVETE